MMILRVRTCLVCDTQNGEDRIIVGQMNEKEQIATESFPWLCKECCDAIKKMRESDKEIMDAVYKKFNVTLRDPI